MLDFIAVLLFFFLIIVVWFSICNERTARYRQNVIEAAFGPPYLGSDYQDREELRHEFDSVKYERHIFHIMRFRNPSDLYPKYHARKVKNEQLGN